MLLEVNELSTYCSGFFLKSIYILLTLTIFIRLVPSIQIFIMSFKSLLYSVYALIIL